MRMHAMPPLLLAATLLGAAGVAADPGPAPTKAVDLRALPGLQAIIPALTDKRVVYIGETHNRYDHHLNQLEIIRALHARHGDVAIGLEFFQQPYQRELDAYVAGDLSVAELLLRSEYFRRWRFDFRLYAPILEYARNHKIPLIALNVPSEIVAKVQRVGVAGLSAEDRAQVPADIDRTDAAYRARLREVFEQHPGSHAPRDLERFIEVQLVWDETMAARAADYLAANPKRRLVVLAGNGHLAHGAGIPRRVERRVAATSAIVLQGGEVGIVPGLADYLLLSDDRPLPPPGTLGAFVAHDRALKVTGFARGSAAEAAGLREDDWILAIDGAPVAAPADVKARLWNKRPGERVELTVRRGSGAPMKIPVDLRAPVPGEKE